MIKLFNLIVFAVTKKILNYHRVTHNFGHSIEVRGTCAKHAHEASINKKNSEK